MSDSSEKSEIPIQNLYYLLCYAWDQLEQAEFVDVGSTGATELVDLFAIILVKGIEHLARRGIERGYESRNAELRGIRGRIDLLSTERRFLQRHGKAACRFDELSENTLANQIIKSTLRRLADSKLIDYKNRASVLRLRRDLKGIDDIRVDTSSFRRVQLGRNTSFYRFLLNVCQLVHESCFAEQGGGRYKFRDFVRDERKMALVFQNFLFNFFRLHRPDFRVFRENIQWKAGVQEESDRELLPQMQTDVSLCDEHRKLIIEAKYYRQTFAEHFGARKIHSHNLYQLLSYLMNTDPMNRKLEGVLVYPTVSQSVRAKYVLCGLPIAVRTVNLAQDWPSVHNEVIALLGTVH